MTSVFVRSRGHRHHDYAWHEVRPAGDVVLPGAPPPLAAHRLDALIWSDDEACVLARFGERVLVLVTALASALRSDFLSRPVRDAILLSAPNEAGMRRLAAAALCDRPAIVEVLDRAISFEDEAGFTVDHSATAELLDGDVTGGLERPLQASCVRRLDDASSRDLADELRRSALPDRDGVLVVASPFSSARALHDARVWRGLAGLTEPATNGAGRRWPRRRSAQRKEETT